MKVTNSGLDLVLCAPMTEGKVDNKPTAHRIARMPPAQL